MLRQGKKHYFSEKKQFEGKLGVNRRDLFLELC